MNKKEKKYTTIEKLENGKITRKEASDELKVSLRQIDTMKKESEIKSTKKEHHIVIPPVNHPWRKNMMLKY